MSALIELRGVDKSYHVGEVELRVLKGIDLSIAAGEFVVIMGASGSGKTTLMNILGCLDGMDAGDYRLADEDVKRADSDTLARIRNQHIGFVFQTFNLLAGMDIVRNVELPLVYAAVPAAERRRRAVEALIAVGLGDRLRHYPGQLSGGQQQRVAIARALIGTPEVLLADEPTGSLDSHNGREIMRLFDQLNARGKTIVMVTHERDIAAYASRQIVMSDGEIV